jgi:hypothetical protein
MRSHAAYRAPRFSLMQSCSRLGAASTSTSGSGQHRPQGSQPCRTIPEAAPEAHPRYITLSDWEGQGERSPSR